MFRPGWTDYNKRIQYQTYDVTRLLQNGANALGVVLGRRLVLRACRPDGRQQLWHETPRPRANADHIRRTAQAETDRVGRLVESRDRPRFSATTCWIGETYDARKELTGWNTPDYDDSAWQKAAVLGAGKAESAHRPLMPRSPRPATGFAARSVRTGGGGTEAAHASRKSRTARTCSIWGRTWSVGRDCKVQGEAGTTIRLRFAEMLNPDGTIYTTNLRGAKAHRLLYLQRERRRDLGAVVHVSRLPLRGGDRLQRQAGPGRRDGRRHHVRHAPDRNLYLLQPAGQPVAAQHLVGAARQLSGSADRLPAARRASGLDGRRADFRSHRLLQQRHRRLHDQVDAGRGGRAIAGRRLFRMSRRAWATRRTALPPGATRA